MTRQLPVLLCLKSLAKVWLGVAVALSITLLPQMALAASSTPNSLPPMVTLGKLAKSENTSLPANIPGSFPLPAASKLVATGNAAMGFIGVSAGNAEQTFKFYSVVLPAMGWTIKTKLHLGGETSIIACKKKQCVNIGAGSNSDTGKPKEIQFQFFPQSVYEN